MKLFRFVFIIGLSIFISQAKAENYYFDDVATHGDGSESSPFNDFNLLQITLEAGDTLFIMPGTYTISDAIQFRNNGTYSSPIVVMAYDPDNRPVIYNGNSGDQMIIIQAHYHTYDGLILDGQYCAAQIISVSSPEAEIDAGNGVTIRNCIVKRTMRDGIILTYTDSTIIDNCEIYNCLRDDFDQQTDAHGIAARHTTYLTVKNCNIHHTSGDCFQIGTSYSEPLWDNVLVKNCKFWTSHLAQNEAGFMAGEKPGENAIDTKADPRQDPNVYRPKITIENVEAFGFRNDPPNQVYIAGRSAFNIKTNVEAMIRNCILYDNAYAYRFRGEYDYGGYTWGSAHVTMINCIAYDNWKALWMERDVDIVRIYNCTFDKKDSTYCVYNASSGEDICNPAAYIRDDGYNAAGFEAYNNVFVGSVPVEITDASNIAVQPTDFRNYDLHEYYPAEGGTMLDKGMDLALVPLDISGYERTNGSYDAGAYEYRGPLDENPTPFSDSWPTSDQDIDTSITYLAKPNPTSNRITFNIEGSKIIHAARFDLINSMGSKIRIYDRSSSTVEFNGNAITIDVEDLQGGIYFLKVLFSNGDKPAVVRFIRS